MGLPLVRLNPTSFSYMVLCVGTLTGAECLWHHLHLRWQVRQLASGNGKVLTVLGSGAADGTSLPALAAASSAPRLICAIRAPSATAVSHVSSSPLTCKALLQLQASPQQDDRHYAEKHGTRVPVMCVGGSGNAQALCPNTQHNTQHRQHQRQIPVRHRHVFSHACREMATSMTVGVS